MLRIRFYQDRLGIDRQRKGKALTKRGRPFCRAAVAKGGVPGHHIKQYLLRGILYNIYAIMYNMIIMVKESSKCDLVICQTKLQIVAFFNPDFDRSRGRFSEH